MANIKISELNPLLTVEDADVLPIVDNAVTKKVTAAILRSYTQGNSVLLTGNQTIAGIKTFTSQLASSVATGTAPFSVASTTKVTNLNADLLDGLSSADFQATLSGTGIVKSTAGTISYLTDNSANWNTAFNDSIVSAAVTGTTTKLLTLNQQDGGTITASWSDIDTAPVTSVFGRTGAIVATSGDYTTTQVTEGTNLYFTDARARAAISLTTTGTSGAATYNSTTGVLNVPNYADTDTGITSLNGLTALSQTFAVGTSGTDFGISSSTSTHTFNLPTASETNRGALSSADWTTFNNKASTAALANYLPLAGGTLTGALNGTSAYFSGNGSFGGATANTNPLYVKTATDSNLRVTDAAGTLQIAVVNDAVSAHRPFMLGNGWLNFSNTGAATFSSSITTGADATINGVKVGRGAGNISTNTAVGFEAINANVSGTAITAIGYQALKVSTASFNTAVGSQALFSNTTGQLNVSLGRTTLFNNTTGSSNTAIGDNSLAANIIGSNNTAIGRTALAANTASNNTAVGFEAANANTTAIRTTAIGYQALKANTTGSGNTAIGQESLKANTTGAGNTAVGSLSLFQNTTGTGNTGIGGFDGTVNPALYANTTGIKNTSIGSGSMAANITGSNNSVLGYNQNCTDFSSVSMIGVSDTATASNQMRFGSSVVVNGVVATEVNASSKVWNVFINGVAQKILLA